MSKLVLTAMHLKSWEFGADKPVLTLKIKPKYESGRILKFGFETVAKGASITISHLTPLIGFSTKSKCREFRSSLREGLFISFYDDSDKVQITLERQDGKDKVINLKEKD